LPIAVGFGIATSRDAARVARCADGVIVGSTLVDEAWGALQSIPPGSVQKEQAVADVAEAVARRTAELRAGIVSVRDMEG